MSKAKKYRQNITYTRNPVYVFYAAGAILLFIICSLFATRARVGNLEQSIINLFSTFPRVFAPVVEVVLLLGSLVVAFAFSIYLFFIRRRDVALRVATSALLAYLLTLSFQLLFAEARPHISSENFLRFLSTSEYDYPSSYMAVATAVGLTISLYVSRARRHLVAYLIALVGIAAIYLSVNLPLDIFGGYALGLLSFSLISLAFGAVYYPINEKLLTRKLTEGGMQRLKLKPAKVDARGSAPFFGTYAGGPVFIKVYNRDNNLADWLFKLSRRVLYRRLEDEVPSLTPKRAIEHEAYITMLAKSVGVRAPHIIGVYKVRHNTYAMATKRIDGIGLDSINNNSVTDSMLSEIWKQIQKLHENRIIHKDLRTANIMIEKESGVPWIIDFGFSESAIDKRSYYKDNVEFIASSATKIGAKRAVKIAQKILGKQAIQDAIPYMQYPALSGATTTALKAKRGLLEEIIQQMQASITSTETIKVAKISRIPRPLRRET